MFSDDRVRFGKDQREVKYTDPEKRVHPNSRGHVEPETDAVDQVTHLQTERPGCSSRDARSNEELYPGCTVIGTQEKDEGGHEEKDQREEHRAPLAYQDGVQWIVSQRHRHIQVLSVAHNGVGNRLTELPVWTRSTRSYSDRQRTASWLRPAGRRGSTRLQEYLRP